MQNICLGMKTTYTRTKSKCFIYPHVFKLLQTIPNTDKVLILIGYKIYITRQCVYIYTYIKYLNNLF